MVTIDISKKDAVMLTELLQSFLEDIKTERVRTDNKELHAGLIYRERLVGDVIAQLEGKQEEEGG